MSFSFKRTKRREDVIVDRLTGAFNRRQLDADIAAGVDSSGRPTATLMVDVDGFEDFDGRNGNQVLERVAWVIMATVRTTDVVYRHEASTFCVLLPSTSDSDAATVAERIRGNVVKMPLLAEYGVTVTVGVAVGPSDDVRDAVDRATNALNDAAKLKAAGVVASDAASSGDETGASSAADGSVATVLAPSPGEPLVKPAPESVEALHTSGICDSPAEYVERT